MAMQATEEDEHVKLFRLHAAGTADGECDATYGRESDPYEGNWGRDSFQVSVYEIAYRDAFIRTPALPPKHPIGCNLWMGDDDWE